MASKKARRKSSNLGGAPPGEEEAERELEEILAGPRRKKKEEEQEEESDESEFDSDEEEEDDDDDNKGGDRAEKRRSSSLKGGKLEPPIDWWAEFRAMIPGTKEYAEEQKLLQEMSEDKSMNIEHIDWELKKCRRVERLLAEGKWTLALERLKQELDFEDFTDFQSFKTEQERKGKWVSKKKRRRSDPRTKYFMGKLMLLLTRMIMSNRGGAEDEDTDEDDDAANRKRLHGDLDQSVFPLSKRPPNPFCTWRAKAPGPEERWYRCSNEKCLHINMTSKDVYGCDRPVYMPYCKYHLKNCHNDHGMLFVRVQEPNPDGICNECFVRTYDRAPPALDLFSIPGVVREPKRRKSVMLGASGTVEQNAYGDDEPRTESSICSWNPNRYNNEELDYQCANTVFLNPSMKRFESVCPYHMSICWMPHLDNDFKKKGLKFPNADALCEIHYIGKHRRKPQVLKLPFPGMVPRKRRTHPLGPLESPRDLVVYSSKDSKQENNMALTSFLALAMKNTTAIKPTEIDFSKTAKAAVTTAKAMRQAVTVTNVKQAVNTLNVPRVKATDITRRLGLVSEKRKLRAILTIQTATRQFLARKKRHWLWARRQAKARLLAIVQLQAWARAQIYRKSFSRRLNRHRSAVTLIASRWRGVMVRERLRTRKAARIITRALAKNYGNMIRLTYQHLLHERWVIEKRDESIFFIQRVMRGFIGRRIAARRRLHAQKMIDRVVFVQKCCRGFLARLYVVRHRRHLREIGRLSLVLESFVRMAVWKMRLYKARKRGMMNREHAVQRIQCFGRLACAKIRTNKIRMEMKKAWDFWNPQHLEKDLIMSMLPRGRYGLPPPQPTTLNISQTSFYQGPSKGDNVMGDKTVDPEIAKLLLSVDSHDWTAHLPSTTIDRTFPHAKFFLDLDRKHTGTLCREDFEQAMSQMWQDTGNDLLQDEAAALVKLFDVSADGKRIPYRPFFAYAMKHTKFCANHGRFICGQCCSFAQCAKPLQSGGQCPCPAFTAHDDGKGKSMCRCGHSRAAHTATPLVVQEEQDVPALPIINKKKFSSSIRRQRRVEDIFQTLVTAGIKVVGLDEKQQKKKRTEKQEAEHRWQLIVALAKKRKLARERATYNQWNERIRWEIKSGTYDDGRHAGEGLSMLFKDMDDLWPMFYREALYIHRLGVDADQETRSLVPIVEDVRGLDSSVGRYKPPFFVASLRIMRTEIEMVLAKGNLPRTQSHDELITSFKITVPIPLIARNELRLTTHPVGVYLHLLKLLADNHSSFLQDHKAFTNVVAHYFVFLRRFWKHLIKDIRSGRLSEYLPLTKVKRQCLESQMTPDPDQAKKVERLLYLHGFHQMSSGRAVVVAPSLDDDSSIEGDDVATPLLKALPRPPSSTPLLPEYASPFRLKTLTHKLQDEPVRRASAPAVVASQRQQLLGSQVSERITISAPPALIPRKVRGSVSDIDKTVLSNKTIFKVGYELIRQPLPQPLPTYDPLLRQDQRHRRRFVCGHPACGQAFTNHEILLEHQSSHNLRYRLGVATPESDQHMHRFWPNGSSWNPSRPSTLNCKLHLHTPFSCPITVSSCRRKFATQEALLQHLRCGHTKFELQKMDIPPISGVEWIDSPRLVPPFAPPVRAVVPICPIPSHFRPRFRCALCRANQSFHGPKAPLKFYNKGKITLKDGSRQSVSFLDPESTICVEGIVKGTNKGLNPVHCAGICEDRTGQAWIAFSRYLDGPTLKAKYNIKKLPKDLDREHEVIQCLEVEWATIDCIKGYSFTLSCTGPEYRKRKQEGSLPKSATVKFSRFVYSIEKGRLVGDRTLPGTDEDPYSCIGIRFHDLFAHKESSATTATGTEMDSTS